PTISLRSRTSSRMSAADSEKCIVAVEMWPDMTPTCSATSLPCAAITRTWSASVPTFSNSGSTLLSTRVTVRTTRPTTTAMKTIATAITTNETATTTRTQNAGSFVLICRAGKSMNEFSVLSFKFSVLSRQQPVRCARNRLPFHAENLKLNTQNCLRLPPAFERGRLFGQGRGFGAALLFVVGLLALLGGGGEALAAGRL